MLNEDFLIFWLSSQLHALLMVSLQKGNPNQLFIYSMEVHIYIGFWTLKTKSTPYGLYGQATFKNARVITGLGQAKVGTCQDQGDRGSGLFDAAPARCSNACNAHRRDLNREPLWTPTKANFHCKEVTERRAILNSILLMS
jgi:hypothetical protein